MKDFRLRAARGLLGLALCVLALAACSGTGAGSDPQETKGTLLLLLPPEIKPSEIGHKAADGLPEGEDALEGDESPAPPDEQEEAPPEIAAQEPSDEPAVAAASFPAEDTASGETAELPEDAALAGSLPAADEPLEEGIPVLRYSLYMVSALGFALEEEIEPSENPVAVAAESGRWKIAAIAEGADGEAVAKCELKGVALSAGEEKRVAFEWEAP